MEVLWIKPIRFKSRFVDSFSMSIWWVTPLEKHTKSHPPGNFQHIWTFTPYNSHFLLSASMKSEDTFKPKIIFAKISPEWGGIPPKLHQVCYQTSNKIKSCVVASPIFPEPGALHPRVWSESTADGNAWAANSGNIAQKIQLPKMEVLTYIKALCKA